MIFSSTTFLFLFLPTILLFYFAAGNKITIKNYILLFASLFFYSWGEASYVMVMILSIAINYMVGLSIDKNQGAKRRRLLILGLILNIAILGHFKYTNFVVQIVNDASHFLGSEWLISMKRPIHLPIGISFFTFQAISYIVDVYRKEAQVRKNPINLALYISLFPQLIAGPIIRYSAIADQIKNRSSSLSDISYGLQRFTIGLGKKVIIANSLGFAVDQIFLFNSSDLSSSLLWVTMILYGLQIFYDFSGYSDMAIGLGRVFGFKFLENFNSPYIARSLRDFWRRWHISLSTWFRDYLYIPLGGNKKGTARTYFNLIAVFFLCGLWHGASWNFLIWGLFHGLFLALERIGKIVIITTNIKNSLPKKLFTTISHIYLIFIVTISWVFFRSESLPESVAILKNMLMPNQNHVIDLSILLEYKILYIIIPMAIFLCTPICKNIAQSEVITKSPIYQASLIVFLTTILFISITMVGSNSYNPFIYFQF